jgi:GGDEF domain-containing protein
MRFRIAHRYGLGGIGVGVTVYGLAAALLIMRAPAILGDRWAWVALLLVPALTILIARLQTGTALALVLVYAFGSATVLAVQGYRLGWGEITQLDYVLSHFAAVFFMASSVALTALLRSRQEQLEQARRLVEKYVSKDEITGLLTRSAFLAATSRELSRSFRTARPFLLLSIDLTAYFAPAAGSASMASAERMLGEILCSQTRDNQDLWTKWADNVYLGLLAETDEQAVEPALGRVLGKILEAPAFSGRAVVESARFSVSSFPADGSAIDSLVDLALQNPVPLEELLRQLSDPSWSSPTVTQPKPEMVAR